MTAVLLNGKTVAAALTEEVMRRVEALAERGKDVVLATVLVGEDPASQVYVRNKRRLAAQVGIQSVHHELSAATSRGELLGLLRGLNDDADVDAILVQLPLPEHIDENEVLTSVDPDKDADGIHPRNLGLLVAGEPFLVPNTPAGVLRILRHYEIPTEGRRAVVVGRSVLVGRPLALLLGSKGVDATVTTAHTKTPDLAGVTRQADILAVAVGVPRLIGPEHVQEGAVVIDVGISREDQEITGDVDFDAVSEVASAITPVPGGVGPMTVANLMANTVAAAERRVR
ncbi:MAG: bifunctional 5,10-methylenetetrahydrofolate dehydrogenase/5,10-methenyltetrahydrofolate cyclohydrolase [Acidimicrobiia bacterium]